MNNPLVCHNCKQGVYVYSEPEREDWENREMTCSNCGFKDTIQKGTERTFAIFAEIRRKNLDVKVVLADLRKTFPKYDFEFDAQGGGWCRVFVRYFPEGETIPCSLGRINFCPPANKGPGHDLYGVKHYKPAEYEYAPEDAFFYQFDTWFRTGLVLDLDALIEKAKALAAEEIAEKQAWRDAHPSTSKKGRRPKLTQTWMGKFHQLVREEQAKYL